MVNRSNSQSLKCAVAENGSLKWRSLKCHSLRCRRTGKIRVKVNIMFFHVLRPRTGAFRSFLLKLMLFQLNKLRLMKFYHGKGTAWLPIGRTLRKGQYQGRVTKGAKCLKGVCLLHLSSENIFHVSISISISIVSLLWFMFLLIVLWNVLGVQLITRIVQPIPVETFDFITRRSIWFYVLMKQKWIWNLSLRYFSLFCFYSYRLWWPNCWE